MFPSEGFSLRKQTNKKVILGKVWWIGRWDTRIMPFWVRNCWTLSAVWASALINRLPWNGQTHYIFKKIKFTEAECSLSQHHQLVHWYRWVLRTLTYTVKPVLQGVCPPGDNSIFASHLRMWSTPPFLEIASSFKFHSLAFLGNSLLFSLHIHINLPPPYLFPFILKLVLILALLYTHLPSNLINFMYSFFIYKIFWPVVFQFFLWVNLIILCFKYSP